mmetsp:Transcript_14214/g.27816  ORF Transcript_14214/g.27816 Transcript_14214/m.27816 type:complete len:92 (+) Transcript_14214:421-696(+)
MDAKIVLSWIWPATTSGAICAQLLFFEGQVAVMDPGESWTAKWLRIDAYLPGVYAISITGQLDRDIEEELESRGCRWRCRPVGADQKAGTS